LGEAYKKKGLAAKNLSRIIDEAGGIIVPLIPWSMAGVLRHRDPGCSCFFLFTLGFFQLPGSHYPGYLWLDRCDYGKKKTRR